MTTSLIEIITLLVIAHIVSGICYYIRIKELENNYHNLVISYDDFKQEVQTNYTYTPTGVTSKTLWKRKPS